MDPEKLQEVQQGEVQNSALGAEELHTSGWKATGNLAGKDLGSSWMLGRIWANSGLTSANHMLG